MLHYIVSAEIQLSLSEAKKFRLIFQPRQPISNKMQNLPAIDCFLYGKNYIYKKLLI